MDADAFLRTTLDPVRLAVLGLVAAGPRTVDEVAAVVSAPRRDLLEVLGTLTAHGLLSHDDGTFRLDVEALRTIARSLPKDPPADPRMRYGMTDDEAGVIDRFFVGTRLPRLPVQRSRRLIVLERLALEFEPGQRYPERAVNDILRMFNDDYTTLRRALVDERLLDREAGWYWRSGGRVLVADLSTDAG